MQVLVKSFLVCVEFPTLGAEDDLVSDDVPDVDTGDAGDSSDNDNSEDSDDDDEEESSDGFGRSDDDE